MLENGEIIMGEGYFDRKIYNANSKRLTDDLNINVKYDSKKQRVYITDGSEEVFEGFCFDVADLIYEFRVFGRGRLEDLEMTWDEPKKEEIQQQRLSLLLTLGVSPKKLVLSYAKLLLPVIVGTTLLVNIVVYAAVSRIVPIQSILDLIRIHTSGRVFEFHKPVGSQILVSILLMVFWLSAALLPIFSFIRKKASKGDIL